MRGFGGPAVCTVQECNVCEPQEEHGGCLVTPANLGKRKEHMKRFGVQQEQKIKEQKAMEREMDDAESCIAATMKQVEINNDDSNRCKVP